MDHTSRALKISPALTRLVERGALSLEDAITMMEEDAQMRVDDEDEFDPHQEWGTINHRDLGLGRYR